MEGPQPMGNEAEVAAACPRRSTSVLSAEVRHVESTLEFKRYWTQSCFDFHNHLRAASYSQSCPNNPYVASPGSKECGCKTH